MHFEIQWRLVNCAVGTWRHCLITGTTYYVTPCAVQIFLLIISGLIKRLSLSLAFPAVVIFNHNIRSLVHWSQGCG